MSKAQHTGVACGIDRGKVAALDQVPLSYQHKAIPGHLTGQTAAQLLGKRPTLADFQTPLMTLSAPALDANLATMAAWCEGQGVLIAPHGKTTMAPQLWQAQIDAGAWGITLATTSQLRVAHHYGVSRVMLANTLADPHAITWLARVQGKDFQVTSWVDNAQTVDLIANTIKASAHPDAVFDVILDLGGHGGRTGVRESAAALELARRIAALPQLRLVGVGGYEGAFAHTASSTDLGTVRDYLGRVKDLHNQLLDQGLYARDRDLIVTAGGSAYFDDVVAVLGPCASTQVAGGAAEEVVDGTGGQRVDVIIRSGAYLIHDDGFYRGISPFSRAQTTPFTPAMHVWARITSLPEDGLAILDCGKRDVPFDEGLPEPQLIANFLGGPTTVLNGAQITATNDQHSFMRFAPGSVDLNIGDVVRLGLSHPCTAFDKWTLIPVFDNAGDNPRLADLIHTFF